MLGFHSFELELSPHVKGLTYIHEVEFVKVMSKGIDKARGEECHQKCITEAFANGDT